jgi:hypothetical protein
MSFCLLHGKWHEPSSWDPLVRELELLGHDCLAPPVPSHDPAAGYEALARPAIEALAGVDGPIAVVGHSLAAAVAPLVALQARASLLVYICPAPVGPFAGLDVGVAPLREGFPFPPDREDGTSAWEPDAAIAAMYPRLAPATARELADRLRPGATMPSSYPLDGNPTSARRSWPHATTSSSCWSGHGAPRAPCSARKRSRSTAALPDGRGARRAGCALTSMRGRVTQA